MDRGKELHRLETLADWLDSRFRVPGTPIRIGLDSLLGLLPGIGDGVLAVPSIYLIVPAWRRGMPRRSVERIAANVGANMLIGAIPLVGDLFDIGFKANQRNVALLRRYLESHPDA